MSTKHLTSESRVIIDRMLAEGKKIKEIVDAVKAAEPTSTIKYDNVYNYKKRCEAKANKQVAATQTTSEDQNQE